MVEMRLRKLERALGTDQCHRDGGVIVFENERELPALFEARRCAICNEIPKMMICIPDNGRGAKRLQQAGHSESRVEI